MPAWLAWSSAEGRTLHAVTSSHARSLKLPAAQWCAAIITATTTLQQPQQQQPWPKPSMPSHPDTHSDPTSYFGSHVKPRVDMTFHNISQAVHQLSKRPHTQTSKKYRVVWKSDSSTRPMRETTRRDRNESFANGSGWMEGRRERMRDDEL